MKKEQMSKKRKTLMLLVALFFCVSSAFSQSYIQGKVVDKETEEPIVGVAILIKGSKIGTVTDAFGEYRLKVDHQKKVELSLSCVGYKNTLVLVPEQAETLDVAMEHSVTELDDVVIIGYGTTTKDKMTGSVSTISGEYIEQAAITNILEALQCRVAGVFITPKSGLPGEDSEIQIRGKNSMNVKSSGCCQARPLTRTDPLILVDGVPFSSESLSVLGVGNVGSLDPLSMMNPSDVERIEILKDADATAIYGSRGSNGVILITTKKGN